MENEPTADSEHGTEDASRTAQDRPPAQNIPPHQDRYARQRQFWAIGEQGQQQIEAANVAIIGCGALGTVAAELLCRAGVGRILIIDRDVVEWTNLQRQSLFDSRDAEQGNAKAEAACLRLTEINPSIELTPCVADLNPGNIESLLQGTDLVIDATDNFGIRFLINDWALATSSVWVHGGCVGASGQVRLFDGSTRPCFRCLVPELPPQGMVDTCDTAGVLGSATHAIASMQVTEAIKWLSGNRQQVSEAVIAVDFWNNKTRAVSLPPEVSPNCPACVGRTFDYLQGQALASDAVSLCGRNAVQIAAAKSTAPPSLESLQTRWTGLGEVQLTRFFVRLHIDAQTSVTVFRDGRMVVQGTEELSRARAMVDRFVGQ